MEKLFWSKSNFQLSRQTNCIEFVVVACFMYFGRKNFIFFLVHKWVMTQEVKLQGEMNNNCKQSEQQPQQGKEQKK